jgi:hypothetical protein
MSEEVQEVAVEAEVAVEPELSAPEGELSVAEVAPSPEPSAEPSPDVVSAFAAIARKEAAFQQQQEASKLFKSENEQLKAEIQAIKDARKLAQTNPLEFLKSNGVSIKDLLHQDINGELPAESVMTQKIEEQAKQIEALINAQKEKEETATKQKETTEWNSFVDQVSKFVDNEPKYELLRAGNMQWMVPQLMRDFYENNGREITAAQAADLVEESLEESLEGYFKAEKLQKKYGLSQPASESQETPVDDAVGTEPVKRAQKKPKTLTNQLATGASEKDTGMLSREESLERIARMIEAGQAR